MEYQGFPTVAGLIDQHLKRAAFTNPGAMRTTSLRLPVSAEARLLVLSEILGVNKSALLRDLLMASLLEAEHKLTEETFPEQEFSDNYQRRYDEYRESLLDGSDVKPGDPEIGAFVTDIRKAEEV